jgi:hypothetical protein
MAAGLGFKTFVTGDVLTASDTNGYLMQGVLVFASAAARSSAITSPQEGQTTYLKDTDNIDVYSGSAWVTKSASSSTPKVLQVVSATTTTTTVISSTTLTDTTITASITPTLATSKILVIASVNSRVLRNNVKAAGGLVLLRGATTVADYNTGGYSWLFPDTRTSGTGTQISLAMSGSVTYLDNPATTSATTYKMQGRVEDTADSSTITFQYGSAPSTITLMEIGV